MSATTGTLTATELRAIAERLRGSGVEVSDGLEATLIAGGRSNLTFRLDDGFSQWVLRMPPRAGRTPSAHDVAREYHVTRALGPTEVPVPVAVLLCEEPVLGGPYAIAEFVPGATIQSRSELDVVDDATLSDLAQELVTTLAVLHRVDHLSVGLERFGRPEGYVARQIRRWSDQWILISEAGPLQTSVTALSHQLASRVPAQTATGIVHGDFRIDNTLIRLGPPAGVAAVVDWELSTIGDPVADVAMMCAYRHPAFDLIVGAPGAWTSCRLPAVDELAAAYEAAGGVALAAWDFHLALAYFKIAVIAAGIDHRHRAGVGSGAGFDSSGQAVPEFVDASTAALRRYTSGVGT